MSDLSWAEHGDLRLFKQERGHKYQQNLFFPIMNFAPKLVLKNAKILKIKLFRQSCAKNMGKTPQLKKKLQVQARH